MFKFLIGTVVGILFAIAAFMSADPATDKKEAGLVDGTYTVYSMLPMYDRESGEPVYWLVAGKGRQVWEKEIQQHLYIEPNDVGVYIIERKKLVMNTSQLPSAEQLNRSLLVVSSGKGAIVTR